jgi:hypothetical protein
VFVQELYEKIAQMISSVRKRKGPNDPLLPHHASDMSHLQQHTHGHRKLRRRTNWTETLKNCLVCLVVFGVVGGAIVRFVPVEHLEKHKTKFHHHRKKVVDFANKHKHKVIQPLKELAKIAKQQKFPSLHSRKTVICPNGSKGFLNDDYCDCSDGRDEPKTSACSHILVQKDSFACADGSGFVFASRVNDGVVDCRDGSDEGTSARSRLRRTPGLHEIMEYSAV